MPPSLAIQFAVPYGPDGAVQYQQAPIVQSRPGGNMKGQLVLYTGEEELRVSSGGIDLWFSGVCKHSHTTVHTSEHPLTSQRTETIAPAPFTLYPANTTVNFPFDYTVPADPNAIPATMTQSDVQIHYAIQATVHLSGGFLQTNLNASTTVIMEEFLPDMPNEATMVPLVMANDMKVYKYWFAPCDCFGFEGIRTMMSLPCISFMNGEIVPIQIHIQNQTTYAIDKIEIELQEFSIRSAEGAVRAAVSSMWKKVLPLQVLPTQTTAIEPTFQIEGLKKNIKISNYQRINKLKVLIHINGHFEHIKYEFPLASAYLAPQTYMRLLPPIAEVPPVYPQGPPGQQNMESDDFKSGKARVVSGPFQDIQEGAMSGGSGRPMGPGGRPPGQLSSSYGNLSPQGPASPSQQKYEQQPPPAYGANPGAGAGAYPSQSYGDHTQVQPPSAAAAYPSQSYPGAEPGAAEMAPVNASAAYPQQQYSPEHPMAAPAVPSSGGPQALPYAQAQPPSALGGDPSAGGPAQLSYAQASPPPAFGHEAPPSPSQVRQPSSPQAAQQQQMQFQNVGMGGMGPPGAGAHPLLAAQQAQAAQQQQVYANVMAMQMQGAMNNAGVGGMGGMPPAQAAMVNAIMAQQIALIQQMGGQAALQQGMQPGGMGGGVPPGQNVLVGQQGAVNLNAMQMQIAMQQQAAAGGQPRPY